LGVKPITNKIARSGFTAVSILQCIEADEWPLSTPDRRCIGGPE